MVFECEYRHRAEHQSETLSSVNEEPTKVTTSKRRRETQYRVDIWRLRLEMGIGG